MLGVVWLGAPGDALPEPPEPPDALGALGVLGVLGLLDPVPVAGSPGAVAGPLPLAKSSHAALLSLLTLGKETPPALPLPVVLFTVLPAFVLSQLLLEELLSLKMSLTPFDTELPELVPPVGLVVVPPVGLVVVPPVGLVVVPVVGLVVVPVVGLVVGLVVVPVVGLVVVPVDLFPVLPVGLVVGLVVVPPVVLLPPVE